MDSLLDDGLLNAGGNHLPFGVGVTLFNLDGGLLLLWGLLDNGGGGGLGLSRGCLDKSAPW